MKKTVSLRQWISNGIADSRGKCDAITYIVEAAVPRSPRKVSPQHFKASKHSEPNH